MQTSSLREILADDQPLSWPIAGLAEKRYVDSRVVQEFGLRACHLGCYRHSLHVGHACALLFQKRERWECWRQRNQKEIQMKSLMTPRLPHQHYIAATYLVSTINHLSLSSWKGKALNSQLQHCARKNVLECRGANDYSEMTRDWNGPGPKSLPRFTCLSSKGQSHSTSMVPPMKRSAIPHKGKAP